MKASYLLVSSVVLCAAPLVGRGQEIDLMRAQRQFQENCAKCHGEAGGGDGYLAVELTQQPKDFTNCADMAKESDATLFNVIKNGGPPVRGRKSEMPAMRRVLSDKEIQALIVRVRRFCAGTEGVSVVPEHAAGTTAR